MQTTTAVTAGAAPAQRQLGVYKGSKLLGQYGVANDAPVYDYTVPGHGMKTYGLKDTAGQEYYLTDSGNWRNVATRQLQKNMPTYAATPAAATPPAATTPAPATPTPTAPTPQTWKSVWDFQRKDNNLANQVPQPTPLKTVSDFYPTQGTPSAAYTQEVASGNQEVDRYLSRMGLLGSGAEVEARQKMIDTARARDTARLDTQAKTNYDAYTAGREQDANRSFQSWLSKFDNQNALSLADFQAYQGAEQNDRAREIDKDGQQLDSIRTVLDFLATLNPMQYGFPATNSLSQNQIELGKALSSMAMAGGGGGGGGGGRSSGGAATTPPPPGFNGTSFWSNTVANVLPSILNAFS